MPLESGWDKGPLMFTFHAAMHARPGVHIGGCRTVRAALKFCACSITALVRQIDDGRTRSDRVHTQTGAQFDFSQGNGRLHTAQDGCHDASRGPESALIVMPDGRVLCKHVRRYASTPGTALKK